VRAKVKSKAADKNDRPYADSVVVKGKNSIALFADCARGTIEDEMNILLETGELSLAIVIFGCIVPLEMSVLVV
jgi:hypothetical protein